MASSAAIELEQEPLFIPEELLPLLHLVETETHFTVRTLSGTTLLKAKPDVHHAWELLGGIVDDCLDTTTERADERRAELHGDARMHGDATV